MFALSKGAQALDLSWIWSWFPTCTSPQRSDVDGGDHDLKLRIEKGHSKDKTDLESTSIERETQEERDLNPITFTLNMQKRGWISSSFDECRIYWTKAKSFFIKKLGKKYEEIGELRYDHIVYYYVPYNGWKRITNEFRIDSVSFRIAGKKLCIKMKVNDLPNKYVSGTYKYKTRTRYIEIGECKKLDGKRWELTVEKKQHNCDCTKNGLKLCKPRVGYRSKCGMCNSYFTSSDNMYGCRICKCDKLCEKCYGDGSFHCEGFRFLRLLKALKTPPKEDKYQLEGEGDTVTRMLEAKHGDSLIFKKL